MQKKSGVGFRWVVSAGRNWHGSKTKEGGGERGKSPNETRGEDVTSYSGRGGTTLLEPQVNNPMGY